SLHHRDLHSFPTRRSSDLGMYAITSYPFVKRTLATLRMAELGFLGVRVITCKQTPRRNGAFSRAGDLLLYFNLLRPLRTSWLIRSEEHTSELQSRENLVCR